MQDHRELINWPIKQPKECEWVEFKRNNNNPELIGERISALSNGACLQKQPFGYLVFGIDDEKLEVVGTTFNPSTYKKGNELIEHWVIQRLSPKIDFRILNATINGKTVILFEIPAARYQPVDFQHEAYIRIGSITRKLREFPDKERKIWNSQPNSAFAKEIALRGIRLAEVVDLLDTQSLFDLFKIPYPTTQEGIIEKLISEKLVLEEEDVIR